MDESLGLRRAGMAFHSIESQVEPSSAFEQPYAFSEQVVDLVPAFLVARGMLALANRGPGMRPARRVRGDLLMDCFDRVVPDVPTISALHGIGQRPPAASA